MIRETDGRSHSEPRLRSRNCDGVVPQYWRKRRQKYAVDSGREHDLDTVGGCQTAAFDAHGVGHGQDELVPEHGGRNGQPDAGVAAGGLDDRRAAFEHAATFGVQDHGHADAVLHAGSGVERFDFREDFGLALVHLVDSHERGVADGLEDVSGDMFHGGFLSGMVE